MKIIGINGSPNKNGNTKILLEKVLDEVEKNGIETEIINLSEQKVNPCVGCMGCMKLKNKQCVIKNDSFNEIFKKIIEADGIVLGSPVYTADITAQMKAFLDRTGIVALANGGLLNRKVGAAVVASRRGGAVNAFDSMNHLFQEQQMVMIGSTYWNIAYGLAPGDVEKDEEAMVNMKNLGENISWLLEKIG